MHYKANGINFYFTSLYFPLTIPSDPKAHYQSIICSGENSAHTFRLDLAWVRNSRASSKNSKTATRRGQLASQCAGLGSEPPTNPIRFISPTQTARAAQRTRWPKRCFAAQLEIVAQCLAYFWCICFGRLVRFDMACLWTAVVVSCVTVATFAIVLYDGARALRDNSTGIIPTVPTQCW